LIYLTLQLIIDYVPVMEQKLKRIKGKAPAILIALALFLSFTNYVTAENVTELKLAVVFLNNIPTCIIGDNGNASEQCCELINTTTQETLFAYKDNYNYKGLDPIDPKLGDNVNAVCMNLSLEEDYSDSIREKVSRLVDEIKTDSAGTLIIRPYYIDYPEAEEATGGMALSRTGNGLYPTPEDLPESVKKRIENDTDYVIVVYSLDDWNLGLSARSPGCGAIKGELKGAIYGTLPIARNGTICSIFSVFAEELYYSVKEVTKLPAAFPEEYPKTLCGTYTKSTYDWFPDPEKRSMDPDYEACQTHYGDWTGYCASIRPIDCEEDYLEHLIKNHYPPGTKIEGNHCGNNARDYGETGTDCGGTCKQCAQAATTTSSTTTSSAAITTTTTTSSTTTSSSTTTTTTSTTSSTTTTTSTTTSTPEKNDTGKNIPVSEIGILVSVILFTTGYVLTNHQKKKAKIAKDVTILSDKLVMQLDKKVDYYSKRTENAKTDPEVFEDFIVESSFAEDYHRILKADKSIKKDLKSLRALIGTVKRIRTSAYSYFSDISEADFAIEKVLNGSSQAAEKTKNNLDEFYLQNLAELSIAEKDESIYEMIVAKCITIKDKIIEVRNEFRAKAYQPKKPGTDSNG
jgi:hypothetical protein